MNRMFGKRLWNSDIKFIRDQARGHWSYILESFGVNPSFLKNKHGPCPHCGGKDRFRFDDKHGIGTFFCNRCGSGDGFQLIRLIFQCNFSTAKEMVFSRLGLTQSSPFPLDSPESSHYMSGRDSATVSEVKKAEFKRQLISETWSASKPVVTKNPVDCYLKNRGIALKSFPCDLRFHPSLPYYEEKMLMGFHPAMLAAVRNINGDIVTVHRTYLGDGCKADVPEPKKIMSPEMEGQTNGTAIRLYEPIDGILAVSEGIETALAFKIATGIPVWAAMTANGMERIILPDSVIHVNILVDNDLSGRGQRAAIVLASRLLAEGRLVRRIMPPVVGQDFADLLMEGRR